MALQENGISTLEPPPHALPPSHSYFEVLALIVWVVLCYALFLLYSMFARVFYLGAEPSLFFLSPTNSLIVLTDCACERR